MRKLKIGFLALISLMLVFSASNAGAQEKIQTNKAKIGQWADNGKFKIMVSKVDVVTNWNKLGLSKRYTPAIEKEFAPLKRTINSGEAKFVLVTVEAKNTSEEKMNIGFCIKPASPGDFYIRGDEGTEQSSANKNQFYQEIKRGYIFLGYKLSFFLQNAFPENAKVSPGGSVKGRMLFVVPSYFKPKVFFTKPGNFDFGKNEFIIRL